MNTRNVKRKAVVTMCKLKTIAGRQVCELERILTDEQNESYADQLIIYNRVLAQTATVNKVISILKPQSIYVAMCKASHTYEFGPKVSMILTANNRS